MTNKTRNKIFKAIFNTLLSLMIIPLLLVIFVDSPYIPSFDKLFGDNPDTEISEDSVTFINVGEGDAILIRSNGRYALVDTGDGESTDIVRSLEQNGVLGLDALILTHWHDDHVGGALSVMEKFPVMNLVIPRLPNDNEDTYDIAVEINDAAEEKEIRFALLTPGMAINVGDFKINVLYYNPDNSEENDRSAVLMARFNDKKFLLMADATENLENEMLSYGINFDADVIKIAHHGSNTSTTDELLKATSPDYAVISVARINSYGHPAYSVLKLLEDNKINILRTDMNGSIKFTVEQDEIKVSCALE